MRTRHPAWADPGPEWVPMAPGIRWHMTPPTRETAAGVAIATGEVMRGTYEDPAFVAALAVSDPATAAERVAGHAAVVAACLYARRCLIEWEGVLDPQTGKPADPTDPVAIRKAVIEQMAPGRPPGMVPLLAWVERPHIPFAAEARRLRATSAAHWAGEAASSDEAPQSIEAIACLDMMMTRPDLWCEAVGDRPAGLDYAAALIAFESQSPPDLKATVSNHYGTAYAAFRAIEAGRLEGVPHG